MATWSRRMRGLVIDFLFPSHCIACGKEGAFLCDNCRCSLPRIVNPICSKCGKPEPTGVLCPSCWGWQSQIDGIRAPFRFDGVIRQAIHELKYRNLRAVAGCLAELLHSYYQSSPMPGEVLVPVPLYPAKLRSRGYNQSALIARELGRLAVLSVVEGCLVRVKDSLPQARTDNVDQRRVNVLGAFLCVDQRLSGKRVLLIDDVSTSGSTLEACAVALKSAGSLSVWGLTLAREI